MFRFICTHLTGKFEHIKHTQMLFERICVILRITKMLTEQAKEKEKKASLVWSVFAHIPSINFHFHPIVCSSFFSANFLFTPHSANSIHSHTYSVYTCTEYEYIVVLKANQIKFSRKILILFACRSTIVIRKVYVRCFRSFFSPLLFSCGV